MFQPSATPSRSLKYLLDKLESTWIASELSLRAKRSAASEGPPLGVRSQIGRNWSRHVVSISRRTLLQVVTVASTTAFLIPNATAAFSASAPAGLPSVETSPGAINAYMAKTRFSGFGTLSDIQEEYRDAASIFPLVLPTNWSFPEDPGQTGADPKALWERGSGVATAYMIWQIGIATDAYEGHTRGDSARKDRNLNILEAAYATEVRKAVLIDDDNVFIDGTRQHASATESRSPLQAARDGDFAPMRAFLRMD